MVMALLAILLAVSISGLKVYGTQGHGPLAQQAVSIISPAMAHKDRDDNDDDDAYKGKGKYDESHELWEEIHEVISNFT
ncbi:MAG: cytochrome B, partial [Gammaproteobacteria bacterium]|nr:cytochrome B [Gammaproteobacteria bacterium]